MRYLLYTTILVCILSCGTDRNDDCITTMGNVSNELRSVDEFSKLYVEDRIKVVLIQDSSKAGTLELTGPENLLAQVTSEIQDGELRLRNRNTCNFVRSFDYELKVNVFINTLDRLTVESIAEVSCIDTILVNRLEIYHFALSDIDLKLSGEEVYVQSRNSAETRLSGDIRVLKGSIEEISNLLALDLQCEEVLLDSHTKLNCELNASKGLYIKIFNSGDVLYKSEPTDYKIVEVSTGTGRLLKK